MMGWRLHSVKVIALIVTSLCCLGYACLTVSLNRTLPEPSHKPSARAHPMRNNRSAGAVRLPVVTSSSPEIASNPSPHVQRTAVAVPAPMRVIGVADPHFVGQSAAVQVSQLAAMKAIGIISLRIDANWDSVQYGGP